MSRSTSSSHPGILQQTLEQLFNSIWSGSTNPTCIKYTFLEDSNVFRINITLDYKKTV
jgi:hypothetical protein